LPDGFFSEGERGQGGVLGVEKWVNETGGEGFYAGHRLFLWCYKSHCHIV